jgi:hypothetical protein
MESKQDEDQAAAISISNKGKKTRKRKTSGQPKPLDDKRKEKDRIDTVSPWSKINNSKFEYKLHTLILIPPNSH